MHALDWMTLPDVAPDPNPTTAEVNVTVRDLQGRALMRFLLTLDADHFTMSAGRFGEVRVTALGHLVGSGDSLCAEIIVVRWNSEEPVPLARVSLPCLTHAVKQVVRGDTMSVELSVERW